MQSEPAFSILLFPLLKTSGPVRLGGVTFRSTGDVEGRSSAQRKAIRELRSMLFLQGDYQLKEASYAIVPGIDFSGRPPDLTALEDIQAVVAYSYGTVHPSLISTFLSVEHSAMLVLTPTAEIPEVLVHPYFNVVGRRARARRSIGTLRRIRGYEGRYNFRAPLWVATGSRIYGPLPHMTLNHMQDLSIDCSSGTRRGVWWTQLRGLLDAPDSSRRTGVLTALRWFNRGNSSLIDDDAGIVHLAIGFEALLGLPENAKTDRFVDAIALLLGRVPRLESWARQFYEVRSKVVHEGRSDVFRFRTPTTSAQAYLPLIAYGRSVFRMCVATLLSGMALAAEASLGELFVTNEERFAEVCRLATDSNLTAAQRLAELDSSTRALERYRFAPEVLAMAPMIGAIRAVAKLCTDVRAGLPTDAETGCQRLLAATGRADSLDVLEAIREINAALPEWVEGQDTPELAILRRLAGTVWSYIGNRYYALKDFQTAAATPAEVAESVVG